MPKLQDPHRIGKGQWSDHEELDYIAGPGEGSAFFGCNPSWTPACEAASPFTCPRCGGKGLVFDLADPDAAIAIPLRFDPSRHAIVTYGDSDPIVGSRICCGCMRWGRDEWLSRRRATDGPVRVSIAEGGSVPMADG